MELKIFVAETILQIMQGVADAQSRSKEIGGRVNPHLTTTADLAVKHGILIASGEAAQLVQFDVAVAATEGSGTKGGVGVVLGTFTLGSSGQSQAEKTASSRVKFFVPVVLPEYQR